MKVESNFTEVKMSLPEIEGYEYTGEYREADYGELVVYQGKAVELSMNWVTQGGEWFILRKKRWRAKNGHSYWFVDAYGHACRMYESGSCACFRQYEIGNYFQTKEEAEAMAEKVRELFKNG